MPPNDNQGPNIRSTHREPSPVSALLSYLVPGLGQILQGRVAKGLLFMFSLYTLFFFGMYLGNWRNVYIYRQPPAAPQQGLSYSMFSSKARFFGQVWIGVVAWPAILQYSSTTNHPVFGEFERMPTEAEEEVFLRNSDKRPDLGWMYTVIAGVLNILVIYDAYAGPALGESEESGNKDSDKDKDKDSKKDKESKKEPKSKREPAQDKDQSNETNIEPEKATK